MADIITAEYLSLTLGLELVAAVITVGDAAEDMEEAAVMGEEGVAESAPKGSPSMVSTALISTARSLMTNSDDWEMRDAQLLQNDVLILALLPEDLLVVETTLREDVAAVTQDVDVSSTRLIDEAVEVINPTMRARPMRTMLIPPPAR